MEQKNYQGEELIFPENNGEIVDKVIDDFGLRNAQEEGIEKILDSKTQEESMEIFENLPGTKISRLVREYAEGKITVEKMPSRLKDELSVSEDQANKMIEYLQKELLSFIAMGNKNLNPGEDSREGRSEKIQSQTEKDTYREPIE